MTQLPINIQIKNLRKNLGLTQIDSAKRAGVGLRFLRELEGEKTTVRLDKLNQVLDFLRLHLELTQNENIKSWPYDFCFHDSFLLTLRSSPNTKNSCLLNR